MHLNINNHNSFKNYFSNYHAGMCKCMERFQKYKTSHCEFDNFHKAVNKIHTDDDTSENDALLKAQNCLKLFKELDTKDSKCICPVNPSSGGSCGIPVHIDLFGENKLNGLGPFPIAFNKNSDPEIQGLDSNDEKQAAFKDWVKDTVKKKSSVDKSQMGIVWMDTIPIEHGKYIRENCADLEWSVQYKGAEVNFKGLTFHYAEKTSNVRRKLLAAGHRRGC